MLGSYEQRTEMFMKYVNDNDMISYKSELRFCDIGDNFDDTVVVASWFAIQIGKNLSLFRSEIEKYKDIYSNAYQLVLQKIDKLINDREEKKNNCERKVELFIKFVVNGDFYINSELKFCEISSDIKDKQSIRYWFLWQIFRNVDELRISVSKYEDIYPGILNLIDILIKDCTLSMGCEFLSEEEKLVLFMKYIDNSSISNINTKLSFVDIGAKDNRSSVGKWFKIQLNYNFDKFLDMISKYADVYPKAYDKINYYYICGNKGKIKRK